LRQALLFLCHFSPVPSLGMVIDAKQSEDRKFLYLGISFLARFSVSFPWLPPRFFSNTFVNSVAYTSTVLAHGALGDSLVFQFDHDWEGSKQGLRLELFRCHRC
jgi:hypothetical protein